ncbi:MAG: pyrroline-5-carboxylate reductase family protein, partial [Methanobacteriaceae archaeon]
MTKIGFIGYGNMGSMIINNILDLNILESEYTNNNIQVSNKTISKLDNLKKRYPKVAITNDNIELAKNCNKIFIFVKTP